MIKKKLTIALALVMFFATIIPAFAVEFADIGDHWGRTHIQRMADKGIVSGSDDPVTGQRVYKPDDPVSKVEAMVMLYSMLRETDQLISESDHTNRYQSIMASADIPEWAMRQVAYAIEAEIIRTANLAGFMEDGDPYPVQQSAAREEVAIYFGKAMDTEDEAGSSAASLEFNDTELISSDALPYVNLLVEKDVISGDTENNFNPRQTITRAEMAALMSKAVEHLEDSEPIVIQLPENNGNGNDDEDDESVETTDQNTISGKIDYIFRDSRTIIVVDEEDEEHLLNVSSSAEIIINQESANFSDLREDQRVELRVDEDDNVLRIEVNPQRNQLSARVRAYVDALDYYILDVQNLESDSDTRRFRVHPTTEITIDGRSADIEDLERDDEILIYHDGINAIRITDITEERLETQGILESISMNRYPFSLTIRTIGNQLIEYDIGEDVRVYIDDKRDDLSGLASGDIISLIVEDDKVIDIDAYSRNQTQTEEGNIKEVVLSRPNRITIIDRDNEERTFNIKDSVRVYIDDERASLGDLSVNASVELTLEGGEVIEIEASRSISGRNVIQGEITRFYDSINRMIVNYINPSTDRYEDISVYVTRDTVFIDEDGRRIDFGDLDRRDYVLITGSYEDDSFVATRVVIIED